MNGLSMHTHFIEQLEGKDGGIDRLRLLLDKCLEQGVKYLSITDHKTFNTYNDYFAKLNDDDYNKYKDIKLMPGLELTGIYSYKDNDGKDIKIAMDILGYNIDITKTKELADFVNLVYGGRDQDKDITETLNYQKWQLDELVNKANENGFILDKSVYDVFDVTMEHPYAGRMMADALTSDKLLSKTIDGQTITKSIASWNVENGLSKELLTNPGGFYNRCVKDPYNCFYLDLSKYIPDIKDVMDFIKNELDGNVVFDHTAAYFSKQDPQAWQHSQQFTENFLKQYSNYLTAVETEHVCYIGEGSKEYIDWLKTEINKYGLLESGGTDYHNDKNGRTLSIGVSGKQITKEQFLNIDSWAKFEDLEKIREINEHDKEIIKETQEL